MQPLHLVPDPVLPAPADQPEQPHGSTEHCNRTSSGPVQRPLPQPPADVPWPSVEWHAHYRDCPDGRRCRHRFDFPDWWLAMRNRGAAFHDDADLAMQEAVRRVNGYKGHPMLQPAALEFAQAVALDSLALAPTPVGDSWLNCTFAAVGGLSRWAHSTGQPMTREHLLGEETRYRYVEWAASDRDWSEGSRNVLWNRLELIGDFILGTVPARELRKPTITEEAPINPLTLEQQADLWVWANTVRPLTRRQRVVAMLALGLGCGLTGGEVVRVAVNDLVLDADGSVHVIVRSKRTGQTRLVTCLAEWEDRLSAIAATVTPGHYLTTPWRTTAPSNNGACESLRRAMDKNPPAIFNPTRLRNTWLCGHLMHGTPLRELMGAADMAEANHLHNLLRLLPEATPSHAKTVLRGLPRVSGLAVTDGDHA